MTRSPSRVNTSPQIASHRLHTPSAARPSPYRASSQTPPAGRRVVRTTAHPVVAWLHGHHPAPQGSARPRGARGGATTRTATATTWSDGCGPVGLEEVGDASVYGTLRRLYAAGALTSYVVPSDEGPHRKYYGITGAGRAQLKQQREDWAALRRAPSARCSTPTAHWPIAGAATRAGRPMNDTMHQPDVAGFVAQVRARLADLTEEEREELLGGLEADLAERLAEGEADLGDPVAYAAELRAAAGLEARPRRGPWPSRCARAAGRPVTELLDARRRARRWWPTNRGSPSGRSPWHLRPLWWFSPGLGGRAAARHVAGPRMPTLRADPAGGRSSASCCCSSRHRAAPIGRGRWWPGAGRDVPAPPGCCCSGSTPSRSWWRRWCWGRSRVPARTTRQGRRATPTGRGTGPGLIATAHYVTNVFPYDAQGNAAHRGAALRPGRPAARRSTGTPPGLPVRRRPGDAAYPWFNGGPAALERLPAAR